MFLVSENILDFLDCQNLEKACALAGAQERKCLHLLHSRSFPQVTVRQPRKQCVSLLCVSGRIWKFVATLREEI